MALRVTRKDKNNLSIRCTGCKCTGSLSRQSIADLFAGDESIVVLGPANAPAPEDFVDVGDNFAVSRFITQLNTKRKRNILLKALKDFDTVKTGSKGVAIAKVKIAKPGVTVTRRGRS